MDVLHLKELFFSYNGMPVLENVSMQIKKNEFVGLIGPNGGGKTTLLKLAMGFLKPQKGTISLFGLPPQNSLLKIGYVPQVMHFDRQFPLTVLELVLGGRLSKLPWYGIFSKKEKNAAMEALERVGLENFSAEAFSSLSGGQAQRALIARALATPNLELLILDEPTANIDAEGEEQIYLLLKSLHSTITIMMVTHDLQASLSYFNRVFCVHRQVEALAAEHVCEHYALGLYHSPLAQKIGGKKE